MRFNLRRLRMNKRGVSGVVSGLFILVIALSIVIFIYETYQAQTQMSDWDAERMRERIEVSDVFFGGTNQYSPNSVTPTNSPLANLGTLDKSYLQFNGSLGVQPVALVNNMNFTRGDDGWNFEKDPTSRDVAGFYTGTYGNPFPYSGPGSIFVQMTGLATGPYWMNWTYRFSYSQNTPGLIYFSWAKMVWSVHLVQSLTTYVSITSPTGISSIINGPINMISLNLTTWYYECMQLNSSVITSRGDYVLTLAVLGSTSDSGNPHDSGNVVVFFDDVGLTVTYSERFSTDFYGTFNTGKIPIDQRKLQVYYAGHYTSGSGTIFSSPASITTIGSTSMIVGTYQNLALKDGNLTGFQSYATSASKAYNAASYNLLGQTILMGGSMGNLTSNDGTYTTFRSYYSGTHTSDFVYSNTSNVDASADKGTHSNFDNQKAKDNNNDTLTEVNTATFPKYYPSNANPLNATQLVSGSITDLQSNNEVYMTFRSWPSQNSSGTFGNTNTGTDYYSIEDTIAGSLFTATDNGWANSITAYLQITTYAKYVKCAIYKHSDLSLVAYTQERTISPSSTSWQTFSFADPKPSLTAGTQYILVAWSSTGSGGEARFYRQNGDADQAHYDYSRTYGSTWPNPFTVDGHGARNFCIYCTYTKPTEYTSEVEFTGTSNTQAWSRLIWTSDSSYTTTGVAATSQLYNYQTGMYPTSGDGYNSTTIGTADVTVSQTITTNPTYFRDASGNWKLKLTGKKATNSVFDCKVDLVQYEAGRDNYELDLEEQWTTADYNRTNEYLCVYSGSVGSENLGVDVWSGGSWQNVFSSLANGWNNVSVSSYLTSSTFTIRFKGGNETDDFFQDSWSIDAVLLHVWTDENTVEVELSGSSSILDWASLDWTVDSAWTVSGVSATIQLFNYSSAQYPTNGSGYINYTSASPNIDETYSQTISSATSAFRNATGNWKVKIKGVKETPTVFDFLCDWVEFKPVEITQSVDWSAEFIISDYEILTQIGVSYWGYFNKSAIPQTMYIYNWNTSIYDQVETTEIYSTAGVGQWHNRTINSNITGYTSSSRIRIRIFSGGNLSGSFESYADFFRISLVGTLAAVTTSQKLYVMDYTNNQWRLLVTSQISTTDQIFGPIEIDEDVGNYVDSQGTILVRVTGESETLVDCLANYMMIRLYFIAPSKITLEVTNVGSETVNLVRVWVNNSTGHNTIDLLTGVNIDRPTISPGEEALIQIDYSYSTCQYTFKVTTRRGTIAAYVKTPSQ